MNLPRIISAAAACFLSAACLETTAQVTFHHDFEGGSLGKVEQVSETEFRCHVQGQRDERGRNRQASWYYFRIDGLSGRPVSLTLTDFVGEYNDKPGACPMNADTIPVFSSDNEHWQQFPSMVWDADKKEAKLQIPAVRDRLWVAHIPPYPHSRLLSLLEELNRSDCARIEVIGRTVNARDLHLVTVTDFEKPDTGKKSVWLQARQHAWEASTSFVMEGALRFITSDVPAARRLREKIIFHFTPMMDPDGCATGQVRFNAHGYDVNRHWDEVDLRRKTFLQRMPEIWYVKKALFSSIDRGQKIDLMLNLHNTETAEYMETQADNDGTTVKLMQRFFDSLVADTSFDPNQRFKSSGAADHTTNTLWRERQIPVLLMEQRIATCPKLGRRPTTEDRLQFGQQLIRVMGETVLQ